MGASRPAPQDWLDGFLDGGFTLEPASSDASFRSYHRVNAQDGCRYILMDAPPGQEDCRPFIKVAGLLRDAGVHAPEVLRQDLESGYLLLEDLGDTTYLDALADRTRAEPLYADAITALVRMQGIDEGSAALPEFDDALLDYEFSLFREWFLGEHLGMQPPGALAAAEQALAANFHAQPRVFVHRDYHSRNLMWLDAGNPGVLDFQDAVRGPLTYDLASLLRDCYVAWPEERVTAWIGLYRRLAGTAGIDVSDAATFRGWFDLTGVQRHLKATGIFSRLNHRDGKPRYLADIPRTMGYVRAACRRYPALQAFGAWLERELWPAMRARGMCA